ncbi:MAG TPA: hypothetical protein VGB82_19475 [Alphaproteobacteria bacterium]
MPVFNRLLAAVAIVTVVLAGLARFSGPSGAANPDTQFCPMGSCVFDGTFDAD